MIPDIPIQTFPKSHSPLGDLQITPLLADIQRSSEGTSKNLNGMGVWGKGHDHL